MPTDIKTRQLKTFLELMQNSLTREDFTSAFKAVLTFVKKIDANNKVFQVKLETLEQKVLKDIQNKNIKDIKDTIGGIKDTFLAEMSPILDQRIKEHKSMLKEGSKTIKDIEKKMASIRQPKDGENAKPEEVAELVMNMISLPEASQLSGDEVRDKLELLRDDERLDKSAVKGLDDEFKKVDKKFASLPSGGTRRVYQPYRDKFTSDTDGSTKTFYLKREPLKTETIMVFGTDYPIILDPDTDFTISGKALTLTAAVPAPSTGATLVVIYFA